MATATPGSRLMSLDFFRGLIMVALLLGETGIFKFIAEAASSPFTHFLAEQFEHSEWHGLTFWDLLLPAFILISGTSMAFSYHKQKNTLHYPWKKSFYKILTRCGWLLFWGVLIYAVRDAKINLQFSNVLAQLSFITLVSFLTIRLNFKGQFIVSLLCLLIPELISRFSHVPGFDEPFVTQHNFGNYVDLLVLGHVNGHYGTTFNVVSSSAFGIWGLMAGNLLLSDKKPTAKFYNLLAGGALLITGGVLLEITHITPILKWITTSSFVMVTGGVALVVMALLYMWIDIKEHRRGLNFFMIVGMNSIFIYLFLNFFSWFIFGDKLSVICVGLLDFIHVSAAVANVVACIILFWMEWGLCYFLYRKKLFFKL